MTRIMGFLYIMDTAALPSATIPVQMDGDGLTSGSRQMYADSIHVDAPSVKEFLKYLGAVLGLGLLVAGACLLFALFQ